MVCLWIQYVIDSILLLLNAKCAFRDVWVPISQYMHMGRRYIAKFKDYKLRVLELTDLPTGMLSRVTIMTKPPQLAEGDIYPTT